MTGKVSCCIKCVTYKKDCVHVTGKLNCLNVVTEMAGEKDRFIVTSKRDRNFVNCKLLCFNSCSFCRRVVTKERCKSQSTSVNKIYERCFLCRSLEFCNKSHKCCNCSSRFTCRGQIASVLGKMGSPRCQSQSCISPKRRLHSPLLFLAKFYQITHHHKLLCLKGKLISEQIILISVLKSIRNIFNNIMSTVT